METKEQVNGAQKSAKQRPDMSCCGIQGGAETPGCCEDMPQMSDCCSKMAKGMKACQWFPLFPVILGVGLLLLGYYLNAEVTRVMWMLLAGCLALLGVVGLLTAGRMKRMCCG